MIEIDGGLAVGIIVGIVTDNDDFLGLHRVRVEYPVDSGLVESQWCRVLSPMAGASRGLVMLPDIGTEVVLKFAYNSTTPYVLGAVYNFSADACEPYRNLDGDNDKRVFWSRNDHMVIFDDTKGAEKVELGAKAPVRLNVKSAPIWHSLDSANKTISEYCDGNTIWEAKHTISVKCSDFNLEASRKVEIEAGSIGRFQSGSKTEVTSGTTQTFTASRIDVNPSSPPPTPPSATPNPYK